MCSILYKYKNINIYIEEITILKKCYIESSVYMLQTL